MWSRLTAGCSTCHRVISHHGQDKAELAVHTKQSTVLIVSPPQKESLRAAWRSADPKQGGRNLSCAKTTTLAVWDCKERLVAGCRLQLQDLQAGGEGKGSNKPARTNGHPPTHPSTVRLGDTPPHSAPPHVTLYHGHVWHLLAYLQKCSEAVVLEPLPDRTSRPLHTGSFPAQLVPSSQTGRLIIPSFPSLADTWCNATPC